MPEEDEEEEEEDVDPLQVLSKKWYFAQMKHKVSAAAVNHLWNIAFKYVPLVLSQCRKKVPQFIQQRRKLVKNSCPPIQVEYIMRKKDDGNIIHFQGTTAPVKQYLASGEFEKLAEIAYVQVI